MPAYKSYCWALGTTSFRMVEFNRKMSNNYSSLKIFGRYRSMRMNIGAQTTLFKSRTTIILRSRDLLKIKTLPVKIKMPVRKLRGW